MRGSRSPAHARSVRSTLRGCLAAGPAAAAEAEARQGVEAVRVEGEVAAMLAKVEVA